MDRSSESFKQLDPQVLRADRWLHFCFAVISCLGGFALSSGPETESLPIIAFFFAVFGFVVVDWLRVIALPPVIAYIAMAIAAVYCVGDFWEHHTSGNEQMIAVAMLLVLVQAILMLQLKTPRIFEQIAVFCLLQLVVGAVFNDAISFGLLLFPIGAVGAMALSLMSGVAASEGIAASENEWDAFDAQDDSAPSADDPKSSRWLDRLAMHWIFRPIGLVSTRPRNIRSWGPQSIASIASATRWLQRFSLLAIAPAVILVGIVFFYALPRTNSAARMSNRGRALVGFDDSLELNQIGQMLQSSETAMRIDLTNRRSGTNYLVNGSIYLRGKVLENYKPKLNRTRPTATWEADKIGPTSLGQSLPREYVPRNISDQSFYDSVVVRVSCRSMRTPCLFAVAPYYKTERQDRVVHAADRWTVRHRDSNLDAYPPIEYQFGTNAFFHGVQKSVLTRASIEDRMTSASFADSGQTSLVESARVPGLTFATRSRRYAPSSYLGTLTKFDPGSMPNTRKLAKNLLESIPPKNRTTPAIGRTFVEHLRSSEFQYSLNLNATPIQGYDPIEQFVSIDKKGHCQYFASALVMMLRSVNIPARIVVGYRTEEYNDLGQYYVVRQSHAHVWVEALVDRRQLNENATVYGQPQGNQYWIRLDPTPGASDTTSSPSVDQVMNMAENMWDKYVVGMDAQRQGESINIEDNSAMSALAQWALAKVALIRSSKLGPGAFSFRDSATWIGIPLVLATLAIAIALVRFLFRILSKLTSNHSADAKRPRSAIAFYDEMLNCVAALGFVRRESQTPDEFAIEIRTRCSQASVVGVSERVDALTQSFVRQRYSGVVRSDAGDASMSSMLQELRSAVRLAEADADLLDRLGAAN